MNKAMLPATLAICLSAAAIAFLAHVSGVNAQTAGAARVIPLGASGQYTWYLDTDRKLVVMCNAFSDNSFECRHKPMP